MRDVDSRDVVVLIERPLGSADAATIAARHAHLDEPIHYHLLIPVEDAAARVQATIGSLAASEVLGSTALYLGERDFDRIREEVRAASKKALESSLAAMRSAAEDVSGEVTADDPLDRLTTLVAERGSSEVIVLTRPHVVAELLHVDWTSKARKKLSVPCAKLLAHTVKAPSPA